MGKRREKPFKLPSTVSEEGFLEGINLPDRQRSIETLTLSPKPWITPTATPCLRNVTGDLVFSWLATERLRPARTDTSGNSTGSCSRGSQHYEHDQRTVRN